MSKLLFRMRHVPEDEARDVRDLLQKITSNFLRLSLVIGVFQFQLSGISRNDQYTEARKIIDLYQTERADKAKKRLLDQETKGMKLRVSDVFIQNPLRFMFSLLAIIIVLYISLRFFLFF